MAKYRVEVTFDTTTGDYELVPYNVSDPGTAMDYYVIKEALRRIFGDFIEQREGEINKTKQTREDN